jgi:hypothetical protein
MMHPNVVASLIMVAIGVAYMVYLAVSWKQMQQDRIERLNAVNTILDRVKPPAASEGC